MDRIKLSKECKVILFALRDETYPNEVPDTDFDNFNLLKVEGLVKAECCKGENQPVFVCPRLTSEGRAYMTENPNLEDPKKTIDWKFIVTSIVAIIAVIIAFLEYKK